MTTFATNLVSCSAVKVNESNVLFVLVCGRAFWHTVAACFLVVNHMLPKCLGFFGTLWFSCFSIRASFVRMVLTADKTFPFGRTVFSRMAETLADEALRD